MYINVYRGFESLSLRHIDLDPTVLELADRVDSRVSRNGFVVKPARSGRKQR